MNDQSSDAVKALEAQAAAIGALAANQGAFNAALDAFVSADRDGFRFVLSQENLLERCELICAWLCPKLCVLTCLELCGPPLEDIPEQPPFARVAEVIGRIAADESLLAQVVEGVVQRDADDFRAVVEQLGFEDVCHYVCSWFCSILCERVCEIVCAPVPIEAPSAIETAQAAATAVARFAGNQAVLEAAIKAVMARDCEGLREVFGEVGVERGCTVICEWFCIVRCVWVCLELCRVAPPISAEGAPADIRPEAFAFAQAVGRLADQPEALARLTDAVQSGQAEQFAALTRELKLEPYCLQLCRWICERLCVEFCFCVCPPASIAIFTKIGRYYYEYDVASAVGGNGLTDDNRAFFETIRLNGGFALVNGAPQIEYRFETVPTDAAGNPTGSWTPVLPSQIAPTNIGSFVRTTLPFVLPIEVWVNGPAGPHKSVITPSSDGWIQVPPFVPVPGWEFVPGSDLVQLITNTLQPFPAADETGMMAGSSANSPLPADVYYGIRMRVRNVGDTSDGNDAGTCTHVAINNTLYNNVSHHTYWDGYVGSGELAVFSVGIAELIPAGCTELSNSLTVTFTASHPNLDTSATGVTVTLIGPGGPYSFTLSPAAPATPGDWYGNAVPDGWTLAGLPPCAYIVRLQVNVLLTNGDVDPIPQWDQIAFCKSS